MLTKHLSQFHKHESSVWRLIGSTPLRPTKVNKGAPFFVFFVLLRHLYRHRNSGNALFTHVQTPTDFWTLTNVYTYCAQRCMIQVSFINKFQNKIIYFTLVRWMWMWVRVAQSVQRLVTGWNLRGSNPSGGEIFRTRPYRPRGWFCGRLLAVTAGSNTAADNVVCLV